MTDISRLIGTPFRYGGRDLTGFDCWGLCLYMLRMEGHAPPDYTSPESRLDISSLIAIQSQSWSRVEQRRPGLVAIFRTPAGLHCGYVLDEFSFLHAWEQSGGVIKDRFSQWDQRVIGYYEYRAS